MKQSTIWGFWAFEGKSRKLSFWCVSSASAGLEHHTSLLGSRFYLWWGWLGSSEGNESGLCVYHPHWSVFRERDFSAWHASAWCSASALGPCDMGQGMWWSEQCSLPGGLSRQRLGSEWEESNEAALQALDICWNGREKPFVAKHQACISSHSVVQEQKLGHIQPDACRDTLAACAFLLSVWEQFPLSSWRVVLPRQTTWKGWSA